MPSKKEIFQRIILDFMEREIPRTLPRDLALPYEVNKIISLVGPRRSGKTYLLYDLMNQLYSKGMDRSQLIYVNFEDDRLFPLELGEMDDLIQGYYELFPDHRQKQVYFFLDEIQEVDNWEKFVRRFSDQEKVFIYLTGSSSKLLSREIATSLRGRTISYEIFPLSFKEFLRFREVKEQHKSSQGRAVLYNELKTYVQQGGFPELIFLPPELHQKTINEYLDLMLYRDLSERFNIKNTYLLKVLLKYLMDNISNPLSANKIYNTLVSQGYKVGKNTVYDYLRNLEEAFIIFPLSKWSHSIRKQDLSPKKLYTIDLAYKFAMTIQEDQGRVLENLVFLELRRRNLELYYFYEQQEVDFFVRPDLLINVAYSLNQISTRQREKEGLLKSMESLHHTRGLIITWDEKDLWEANGKQIEVRPILDFLLSDN